MLPYLLALAGIQLCYALLNCLVPFSDAVQQMKKKKKKTKRRNKDGKGLT